jgi:hypothetical protein
MQPLGKHAGTPPIRPQGRSGSNAASVCSGSGVATVPTFRTVRPSPPKVAIRQTEQTLSDEACARLLAALGDAGFDAAYAADRGLSREDAVAFAVNEAERLQRL